MMMIMWWLLPVLTSGLQVNAAAMFLVALCFMFKLRVYTVEDGSDVVENIGSTFGASVTSFHFEENIEKPTGWILDWRLLAHVSYSLDAKTNATNAKVWMLTLPHTFEALKTVVPKPTTPEKNKKKTGSTKSIVEFVRKGMYWRLRYKPADIELLCEMPVKETPQHKALATIVQTYKDRLAKRKYTSTFYLHGPPGSRKSTLARLVASVLDASLCREHNPTDPGDALFDLYNTVKPSADKPMVLLIDEADVIIERCKNGSIKPHNDIPIAIKDKSSWNKYFDLINEGERYPYIICILTSNLSPDEVADRTTVMEHNKKKRDTSYLRPGRIHLCMHLTTEDLVVGDSCRH